MWRMFSRNKKLRPSETERLKQLELQFDDLQHDLARVTTQHQKLSGAFYSRFGKGAATTPADPTESKRQLRIELGLVPGKPVPTIRKSNED